MLKRRPRDEYLLKTPKKLNLKPNGEHKIQFCSPELSKKILIHESTTATLKKNKISGMSHNMKEYVRMVEPKNINIGANLFASPVNVEELFADTSDDGLKAPTNGGIITHTSTASDILAQHFFNVVCLFCIVFSFVLMLLLLWFFCVFCCVWIFMNDCFVLMFEYFFVMNLLFCLFFSLFLLLFFFLCCICCQWLFCCINHNNRFTIVYCFVVCLFV